MKKLRKVFAVILSLAMVLAMSMTAFAADYPKETDSKGATVNGLQAGDTVAFHKIIKPHYENKVFTEYEVADETYVIADLNAPTADEITTIAGLVRSKTPAKTATVAEGETSVTEDLAIGTYLVLVTPAKNSDTVYNPMLVSVYYTVDGIETRPVSAEDNFEVNSTPAYAKKTETGIEKTIANDGSGTDGKGDDTAIGDRIEFEIVTDVPAYSSEYTNVKYKITDVLQGLDDVQNVTVYLDSKENEALKASDYKYTSKKNGYEIDLSDYVQKNLVGNTNAAQHQFIVTYDAKLSDDAGVNFDYNNNTATLTYSNTPTTEEDKDSTTYHYTFAIDANLNGEGSYKTGELFKTDDGEEGFREGTEIIEVKSPLEGAKFELTKTDKDYNALTGDAAWTQSKTSTADGRLNFTGLDAGYYTFKETEAPVGYSLNNDVHQVEIAATYNPDGTLSSYTITIDGEATSTYNATYTADDSGKIIKVTDTRGEENATTIKNTKLASLPSTGGIGTTIFTIGGCIIMVVAAGLFFASRRKSSK